MLDMCNIHLYDKLHVMKTSISILAGLITTVCAAQSTSSLMFTYLNNQPKDANSCYQATPSLVLNTKENQVIFHSTDNGTTWIDLTSGLPEGIEGNHVLPKDGGVYLGTKNGQLYHKSNLQSSNWEIQNIGIRTTDAFITGMFDLHSGLYITLYKDGIYKQVTGTNTWKPINGNIDEKTIFSVQETSNGTLIVATASGIFQSKDQGETWKHVYDKNWTNTVLYHSNILLAYSADGIIRSTDNGDTWSLALSDLGSHFKLSVIDGYFVAVRTTTPHVSCSQSIPYVTVSTDGGITWKDMLAGKPMDKQILDLEKVGNYFFSSREAGISRSNDMGKTWQLLIAPPTKHDPWQFEMTTAGNSIFAVVRWGGC